MKKLIYIALVLLFSCSENTKQNFPELKGEYLGQQQPADSAIVFAPGIVSSGLADRDIAFTPDGKELFFTRSAKGNQFSTIFHTKQVNGIWTKPEVFKYFTNGEYKYTEPFVSPDGKKLFFVSDMPVKENVELNYDIWVCNYNNGEWEMPYNIGAPINTTQNEFFPTTTNEGTLYFNHMDSALRQEFIYRSKISDGKYTEPEKLPVQVNGGRARFNAFISPDESFIIIPTYGYKDSYGATDYYIVFRDKNDNWSEPMNMGGKVNSSARSEWSASISPDGKFLFYMSDKIVEESKHMELSSDIYDKMHTESQNGLSDIYWIRTDFIEELRQKAEF